MSPRRAGQLESAAGSSDLLVDAWNESPAQGHQRDRTQPNRQTTPSRRDHRRLPRKSLERAHGSFEPETRRNCQLLDNTFCRCREPGGAPLWSVSRHASQRNLRHVREEPGGLAAAGRRDPGSMASRAGSSTSVAPPERVTHTRSSRKGGRVPSRVATRHSRASASNHLRTSSHDAVRWSASANGWPRTDEYTSHESPGNRRPASQRNRVGRFTARRGAGTAGVSADTGRIQTSRRSRGSTPRCQSGGTPVCAAAIS